MESIDVGLFTGGLLRQHRAAGTAVHSAVISGPNADKETLDLAELAAR
jgi:hypothetical protein